MGLFMFVAGGAQIIGAVFAWSVAASAMHEIVAASLFGFGVLALGIGAIIDKMPKP